MESYLASDNSDWDNEVYPSEIVETGQNMISKHDEQDWEKLSDIDVGKISDVPSDDDDFVLYYDGDESDKDWIEDFHDVNIADFTEDVGTATIQDATVKPATDILRVFLTKSPNLCQTQTFVETNYFDLFLRGMYTRQHFHYQDKQIGSQMDPHNTILNWIRNMFYHILPIYLYH